MLRIDQLVALSLRDQAVLGVLVVLVQLAVEDGRLHHFLEIVLHSFLMGAVTAQL